MKNLFLDFSIREIIAKIKSDELSFVNVAEEAERTINNMESLTHAWVRYDTAHLFEEAKRKDEIIQNAATVSQVPMKLLEGIPFGIKDIFNTKAFPTEMGSKLWKGFVPGNNARVVDSLIEAGGIAVGKTVTAEFAVHELNETLNPHNDKLTPGTSSSGSAAAVARGMVPFALGSQTAGSIVRPASFCGIWGMKPSFGLLPRTAVLKTTDSLDTIGFLSSQSSNLRDILDSMRVFGPNYPYVYRNVDVKGDFPKDTSKPWKVGFVKTHIWEGAKSYAKESLMAMIEKIASNDRFNVSEVGWPDELCTAHQVHQTIYDKSLSYYFQNESKSYDEISPIMSQMIENGKGISVSEYQSALRKQESLFESLDKVLSEYDFVISLGTSSSAPERHVTEIPDPSLIWTLCHVPTIAVPYTRCLANMPLGLQVISRKYNDYILLQAIEDLVSLNIFPKGSLEVL